MIYIETPYRTINKRRIYALMQHENDSSYRYVTLKTKAQLAKEQKLNGKSVNLIAHNYVDPAECPALFEKEPYHFSSFVQAILTVSKRIFPYYMEYRQFGHDKYRSFNKALINYNEIYNETHDNKFLKHIYEIVTTAEIEK